MNKNRLEAFSDGVLAILITILVLEFKVPQGEGVEALCANAPMFLAYVLSFIYIGIYWNNHHHMLHMVNRVNGRILWANLHLLFWLSLVPFATRWLGESHFATLPAAFYGVMLFCAGAAFYILQGQLIAEQGGDSRLREAIGRDLKGKSSPVLYLIGIALAFVNCWASMGVYVFVALMWLVPDRRIEKRLHE